MRCRAALLVGSGTLLTCVGCATECGDWDSETATAAQVADMQRLYGRVACEVCAAAVAA